MKAVVLKEMNIKQNYNEHNNLEAELEEARVAVGRT